MGHIYGYPSFGDPEFIVHSINNGYKFIFLDEQGNEKTSFAVNHKVIESIHAATGYEGKEGFAIEQFRKFGITKWPDRFK